MVIVKCRILIILIVCYDYINDPHYNICYSLVRVIDKKKLNVTATVYRQPIQMAGWWFKLTLLLKSPSFSFYILWINEMNQVAKKAAFSEPRVNLMMKMVGNMITNKITLSLSHLSWKIARNSDEKIENSSICFTFFIQTNHKSSSPSISTFSSSELYQIFESLICLKICYFSKTYFLSAIAFSFSNNTLHSPTPHTQAIWKFRNLVAHLRTPCLTAIHLITQYWCL